MGSISKLLSVSYTQFPALGHYNRVVFEEVVVLRSVDIRIQLQHGARDGY